MTTIFTKIIHKEISAHIVMENDDYLAFLDIRPINPGHTLVIPKKEVDYIFDMEDSDLSGLMTFAKEVALKIQKVLECKKVGVMVAGLEVPHAHIHLVPIHHVLDLNFANAKETSHEDLAVVAKKIRALG